LAGELAAGIVAGGGWVDFVRGADGFASLLGPGAAGSPLAGAVVDALVDRQRRGPLLLVVDDAEWMSPAIVAAVEAIAAAVERLAVMVLLVVDPAGGGPAVEAARRLRGADAFTVAPLPDDDVARIVEADGVDGEAVSAIVAVSGGLPGVARREAAAWAERAASDRLQSATASALSAVAASDAARVTVFDDVLALVAARARRDQLVSASWAGRRRSVTELVRSHRRRSQPRRIVGRRGTRLVAAHGGVPRRHASSNRRALPSR
jgi:hypothetical protein